MKNVRGFFAQTLGWGVAAVACVLLLSAQAGQGSARVQSIQGGSAEYTLDGVTWNPLQSGVVLQAGSTVRTDSMATVVLDLGKNGNRLVLRPATTLALTTLTVDQGAGETIVNTELGLSNGVIAGVIKKLSASSRFEVKTPVSTCGIRGTVYEISASGRVTVDEGMVDVFFTPAGATAPVKFEVPAGYTFEPSENGGRGGVIQTPANVTDALRSQTRTVTTEGARVEVWVPSPTFIVPDRPFNPTPGIGSAQPFSLPPIYYETTPVKPPGAG